MLRTVWIDTRKHQVGQKDHWALIQIHKGLGVYIHLAEFMSKAGTWGRKNKEYPIKLPRKLPILRAVWAKTQSDIL